MKNIIHFYITDHCSTHCPFCCMGSGPLNDKFVSMDCFASSLNSVLSGENDNIVRLIGGEPTTHPDFDGMLRFLLSHKKISMVEIITNGIGIEKKLPIIKELSERFNKKVHIRFSMNYWLLSVNPIFKEEKIRELLRKYQNKNLEFSVNFGLRNLQEDREELDKWRKVFSPFGCGMRTTHLIFYTEEAKKNCPDLYPFKNMICPHYGCTESFVNFKGEIFKACNDLAVEMRSYSNYREK